MRFIIYIFLMCPFYAFSQSKSLKPELDIYFFHPRVPIVFSDYDARNDFNKGINLMIKFKYKKNTFGLGVQKSYMNIIEQRGENKINFNNFQIKYGYRMAHLKKIDINFDIGLSYFYFGVQNFFIPQNSIFHHTFYMLDKNWSVPIYLIFQSNTLKNLNPYLKTGIEFYEFYYLSPPGKPQYSYLQKWYTNLPFVNVGIGFTNLFYKK